MKILFVCGSLEPGKDGVGDYTRRLTCQLIKHNHDATIIAFNDAHIKTVLNCNQRSEGVNFRALRLPSVLSAKKRFKIAQEYINTYNPAWLSLQFVPFAFQRKGLTFGLSKLLFNLGKGIKWHVMFHELWVGMEVNSPKKLVAWGWLQRQLIKLLIAKLKPEVIHTQARIYQMQLLKLGFNAQYLPLFSNIPFINEANFRCKKNKIISLVCFGTLHPGAPVRQLAKEASLYSEKNRVQVILTIIGSNGSETERWAATWKSEGVTVNLWGEQSPEYISHVLTNSSMGISTTPIIVADKSGSIAAMREHGLPVICVRDSWQLRQPISIMPPPGIFQYQKGNFEACLNNASYYPSKNKICAAACKFIYDLSATTMQKHSLLLNVHAPYIHH